MKHEERIILQSNFKFNLGDAVIITRPALLYQFLKGKRGKITHRGYSDTVDDIYQNLYQVFLYEEERVPGIPERWLELDDTTRKYKEDEETNEPIIA